MKKSANLLDFVPSRSSRFRFEVDESGLVTIFVENKGFFNFIAQKILKKPRFSQVHLDNLGSFVWNSIDSKKTVKEIADALGEKFGKDAEPLYQRCALYMNMLKKYGFAEF